MRIPAGSQGRRWCGNGAGRWTSLVALLVAALLLAGLAPVPDRSEAAPLVRVVIGATDTGSLAANPAASTVMATDATDDTLSHYYVWHEITPRYRGPRDSKRVVLTSLGTSGPLVYNPVAIAEWGIHFYENWLFTGKRSELDDFLAQARWLRRSMDSRGRFPYRYRHSVRGIDPPWYSAMAQGIGISVLLRAYQQTGDESFFLAANKAVSPFGKNVDKGGVVIAGGQWLEEYPDSRHVLNGSIFAAFGLWDMMRVTGRVGAPAGSEPTRAERVFQTFTSNLARHLGSYESRGAILYELGASHFSRIPYYDLHLRQLRVLSQLTGDPRFSQRAARWETGFQAYPNPVIELTHLPGRVAGYRAVTGKVRFLYATYYGNSPRAMIRRVNRDGTTTRMASIRLTYNPSGDVGWFRWRAPATKRNATYRVTIVGQPHTGQRRFDYVQHSAARLTILGSLR